MANVILSARGDNFTVTTPTLPYTLTSTSNRLIQVTANTGYYFSKPTNIYDVFDASELNEGISITYTEWTPTGSSKPTGLSVRIALKNSSEQGNLYFQPTALADGLLVNVDKQFTHTTTTQTFDKITSQGQYTIQSRPETNYFLIDGDTDNNYQTINPAIGTLGNVTFGKSGNTVSYAEFTYTAPAEGNATWTLHSKAYPSNGVIIECYNDGGFTTNLLNGAKYLNETVHVVLNAKSGYVFQGTPTYSYNNVIGVYNFTKISDYEYTADIVIENIRPIISAETLLDVKSTFTYELTNCTISDQPEIVRQSKIFTINPISGYAIETTPVVTGANDVTITKLTNGSYRISYTFNPNENVKITAVAVEVAQRYYLKYNLQNVSTNTPAQELVDGTKYDIVLTANQTTDRYLNQYLFDSVPTYTDDGLTYPFVKDSETQYHATIQQEFESDIVVNASATYKAVKIEYELQDCTGTPAYWSEQSDTVTVTVTSKNGYVFKDSNPPKYSYFTGNEYKMTKVSDSVYTIIIPTDTQWEDKWETVYIYATALQDVIPDTDTTVTHGFINIYKPSQDNLKELTKYRFVSQGSGSEYADMGEYIYKLHKVFFNIPTERTDTIQFAYYTTNVVAPAVDREIVNADCGTVAITEQYHNAFDYEGFTTAKIYLPFIGFRDIDINSIMNDSVSLKYKLNVLNADCLAILSTGNRNEIATFEGVAGFDIPYMLNNYNVGINGNFAHNNVYMSSFTPYIQLFTKIPYNAEGSQYGYKTNEWKKLSNINGYAEFQDVNLNLIHKNITQSELNKIKNELLKGVFL